MWDYCNGRRLDCFELGQTSFEPETPTSSYSVNPPMVHSLCAIRDQPVVLAGLDNGVLALLRLPQRRKIKMASHKRLHSKGVASVVSLGGAEKGEELVVTGGNDCKVIWSVVQCNNSSYSIGHQSLATADIGSKVNWMARVDGCGHNVVGVADQTSVVSLYSVI
jgi:hypothetical protein